MNEIDKLLSFLLENSEDERLTIWKKIKYGYKHYYLSFSIDIEEDNNNQSSGSTYNRFGYGDRLLITIDNRNNCIEVEDDNDDNIIIEDSDLVSKWSKKIEEYLSKDLDGQISNVIENTFGRCANKNLHRSYKMKKILKDDESI